MATRKSLKLCTAAFVLIALFAASEVLAQTCLEPDCFVTSTGCKIEAVKGADSEFPLIITDLNRLTEPYSIYADACQNNYPCTVVAYSLSSNCLYSAINQALVDPASCCSGNPFTIFPYPTEVNWKDPGVGGSNGWYKDDTSIRVLVWPSNLSANAKGFYFRTSNNISPGVAPMYLVSGNKQFYGTILSPICQGPVPPLQLTQTGFTVVHPDGSNHMALVTFDQLGELHSVEFCDAYGKNCENAGKGRPQQEVYSCTPGVCESEGQNVQLDNPLTPESDPIAYCCQYITSTVPGKPTTYKAGEGSQCLVLLWGMWWDFCAGAWVQ